MWVGEHLCLEVSCGEISAQQWGLGPQQGLLQKSEALKAESSSKLTEQRLINAPEEERSVGW